MIEEQIAIGLSADDDHVLEYFERWAAMKRNERGTESHREPRTVGRHELHVVVSHLATVSRS
jgi:hypothetical protein